MTLYRKHRPQLFSTILSQEPIVRTITNQIKNNNIAHAYLLCGPRGVGKTTTARVLAKAINCTGRKAPEVEPCNECSSCREISAGNAVDVIEIDAASHTGVDNVRQNIIENAQFKPTTAPYKIFIIDEVHMLSTAAFNALLKTLEEPPSYVLFILATTELHKLPATIVSRCQRFTFKKVPGPELVKHLADLCEQEGSKVDNEVLERIAKKSDGCVRDAVSLLDQLLASGEKKITMSEAEFMLPTTAVETQLSFLTLLVAADVRAALLFIRNLIADGISLTQFADDLVELLRSLLIYSVDPKLAEAELDLATSQLAEFKALASQLRPRDIVELIDNVQARARDIKSSPLPHLPLELLAIEWSVRGADTEVTGKRSDVQQVPTKVTAPKEALAKNLITPNPADTQPAKASVQSEPEAAPAQNTTEEPSTSHPTKKTLTEKVKDLIHTSTFTKTDVEAKWPTFLHQVEQSFPSLVFLLKMAQIAGVEHDTVTLSVQYSFHKEKLSQHNCQQNMEELLGQLLQAKTKMIIIQDDSQPTPADKPELQALASAFGGEIVQ